jgi:PqqA peptide cyclase
MDVVVRPYALLAELTYRCPLHCPYCSNPVRSEMKNELSAEEWIRVIREAVSLGVLQIGFSGGEPLQRPDLEKLIEVAHEAGAYTNLITSAIGLTERRAAALVNAGLDNIQISFQAAEAGLADQIAGIKNGHDHKRRAMATMRQLGVPLSLNVVLHRFNIDSLGQVIAFAEEQGATRLELANTQFYGWAYRNRSLLIPTRVQVEKAEQIAREWRKRSKMEIVYVLPDYFTDGPKPCMGGWGKCYLTVTPAGFVLPCPTAWEIRGIQFDNIREKSVGWIWQSSESFNRFRGTEWMPDPCRSCPKKEIDFGGCRCQAALLTGEAGNTDPACKLSSNHHLIRAAVDEAVAEPSLSDLLSRQNPVAAVSFSEGL